MTGAEKKTGTALRALECLEGLAIERGLDSLSMRDVAKSVGIKLASLQYHYPSKTDLIDAFVEHKIGECEANMDAILESDAPDAIEKAIRYTVKETFEANDRSLYAMIEARAHYDESSERAIQRYMKCYLSRLRSIIGAADPALSKKEALLKATMITSLLEGLHSTHQAARALGLSRSKLSETAVQTALKVLEGTTED